MRRALLALALTLGACSQAPPEPEPLTVEARGPLGSPILEDVDGDPPQELELWVESEGTGRVLTGESQALYTAVSYDDRGRLLAGADRPVVTGAVQAPVDLSGYTEGSRIISVDPQGEGAEILIIDILHTIVQGEQREIEGPFTVTADGSGVPALAGTAEIRRLSSQSVIRGEGPQISVDDDVYVQYSLYRAADGTLVESTWGTGPILLSLSDTFEGLWTGAAEAPVGSRLLIQVPAGQAQGTDDVVIILDILALG